MHAAHRAHCKVAGHLAKTRCCCGARDSITHQWKVKREGLAQAVTPTEEVSSLYILLQRLRASVRWPTEKNSRSTDNVRPTFAPPTGGKPGGRTASIRLLADVGSPSSQRNTSYQETRQLMRNVRADRHHDGLTGRIGPRPWRHRIAKATSQNVHAATGSASGM
jgi:hypothetical protein